MSAKVCGKLAKLLSPHFGCFVSFRRFLTNCLNLDVFTFLKTFGSFEELLWVVLFELCCFNGNVNKNYVTELFGFLFISFIILLSFSDLISENAFCGFE